MVLYCCDMYVCVVSVIAFTFVSSMICCRSVICMCVLCLSFLVIVYSGSIPHFHLCNGIIGACVCSVSTFQSLVMCYGCLNAVHAGAAVLAIHDSGT